MYTHNIIDDALHLVVGVVPEFRVLWHADVIDVDCEDDCIGGVWNICGIIIIII